MSALDDVLNRIADELVDRVLVRVAERLGGRAQQFEGGGVVSRPPPVATTARRRVVARRSAPKQLPAKTGERRSRAEMSATREHVLELVKQSGRSGIGFSELLQETQLGRSSLYKQLTTLLEAGQIARTEAGRSRNNRFTLA